MSMKKLLKDTRLAIILLQCLAVFLILVSVITVRAFGGSVYEEFGKWYKQNFEMNTSVDEVLKNEEMQEEEEELKIVITGTTPEIANKNVDETHSETKKDNSLNTMLWPVNGTITSEFGGRADPFTNAPATHQGLDIAANSGTDISTVMDGIVSKVDYEEDGYGNFVKIRHSGGFETLYAHCSEIIVSEGQNVKAGQCVAKVGSTGRSTGPHLHFETIVGGTALDPKWFLSK